MSILENSDFVITQKGGNYTAMNLNINNILKTSNQPAIVGGGKSIFTKNKLGVPFGLAVMNDLMPQKKMEGGSKINKEMQLIKDDLYDELLSLCNRTERAKKGIRTKTRSKKSKKPKRKKTRKK